MLFVAGRLCAGRAFVMRWPTIAVTWEKIQPNCSKISSDDISSKVCYKKRPFCGRERAVERCEVVATLFGFSVVDRRSVALHVLISRLFCLTL